MKTGKTEGTTERYDAVIVAGDRKASRKVKGKNKSLLVINDRAVICYIVEALSAARYVNDIYIVGPKKRIEDALAAGRTDAHGKKVTVLNQWDSLYANAWNGFLFTIPGHTASVDPESYRGTRYWNKVIMFLPGDIPLLTPYEVDELLANADLANYDYQPGVSRNTNLADYYPQRRKGKRKKKKGIKHAYFHFREGLFRQNNLHIGRPFAIANKIYIEKMYEYRHQREWRDIAKLAWELVWTEKKSLKSLFYFAILQAALMLTSMGLTSVSERLRMIISLHDQVEPAVGAVLGTRLRTVETTYGGAALDIDSNQEFNAIKANFEEWAAHQKSLYERRGKA